MMLKCILEERREIMHSDYENHRYAGAAGFSVMIPNYRKRDDQGKIRFFPEIITRTLAGHYINNDPALRLAMWNAEAESNGTQVELRELFKREVNVLQPEEMKIADKPSLEAQMSKVEEKIQEVFDLLQRRLA